MDALYTPNETEVVIDLMGTPVECDDDLSPRYGEGSIRLTAYGARKLAYSLLNAATDLEHYTKNLNPEKSDSPKVIKWEEVV